jgi:hypothetical protein
MPITPFHLGPGGALYAVGPRYVSFLAFFAANVIIDLEPLYLLVTDQRPFHRFLHTGVGATLVWGATCVIFALARWLSAGIGLPNWFRWQELSKTQIVVGAATGSYSHIALDSLVHSDASPFWPVTEANPFVGAVSPSTVYAVCVASGLVAVALIAFRRLIRGAQGHSEW